MKKGFYNIMSAQFFSSLADNALFVPAIELMKSRNAPEWQSAALVPMFALFYVVLAPIVGALADALPKGRVMLYSNGVKVLGCLLMLFAGHPLISYAIVGLGAAAYSPAKYGILTELLPTSQLVKANGWCEGLTVMSIILGLLLGGQLVGPKFSPALLSVHLPGFDLGIDTPARAAIACIVALYLLAALFNLRIRRTGVEMAPWPGSLFDLMRDFSQCNARLWDDRLGQISLATTTLFWGVSKNLQYLVLAWASVALGYSTTKASALVGVVTVGTAVAAVAASISVRLDRAVHLIVLCTFMGLLVVAMNAVHSAAIAVPFLIVIGALGGYLMVPMNALLQHRGHNLMGSGRSIAVQNFNEQAAILALGALYTGMTRVGLSTYDSIALFGLLTAGVSALVMYWHRLNMRNHPEEMHALLEIARSDKH
jgi:LPLT family lysophospholipid transporter-like MFS transporter